MNQPKSRLILEPETGEPLIGVGAGTVETFLQTYYPQAQKLIRIASAYFSVEGYNIGRAYLPVAHPVRFRILVGREEGDRPQLAILSEIENELRNCKGVYYPAVRELVRRIDKGEFIILDAREMQEKYHCKFYVCDQRVLVHGSGNYTGYGLRSQHEQASATRNPTAIKELTDWFEEASDTARDLTAPLLSVLRNWLKLAPPFHAYLKFLAALDLFFDRMNVPGLVLPVYYQQRVIARAVEHIQEHRAAVILAATGLGKTIMGAELAFQLKRLEIGHEVILVAPSGVHAEWQKHLKDRGFHVEPINTDLLFKDKSLRAYHKVHRLDKLLEKATNQTIILIDEAHAYRNQLRAYWQKHVKNRPNARGSVAVDRIRPVVNEQKATIILLTATPYGTNPKNTESLLEFLPITPISQDMSGWARRKAPTLDEFTQLPFVSSLGLQQVLQLARERGDVADGRVFVQFGTQQRYLPETVYLRRVDYVLPLFDQLRVAFDMGLFAQENLNYPDGYIDEKQDYGTQIVDSTNSQFITAWLGSPAATAECLTKNLFTLGERDKQAQVHPPEMFPDYRPYTTANADLFPSKKQQEDLGYKMSMKADWSKRQERLQSLRDTLSAMKQDDKAVKLLALLKKHVADGNDKAIVFVERHATAAFIDEFLRGAGESKLHVGCTIARQGKDGYTLKEQGPRNELLDNFSPISRQAEATFPVNVLICTDANGIGINLQDANVVINYDSADSADILFQRAGRIIRFTRDPHRSIYLYTFRPTVDWTAESNACKKVVSVFDNMSKHHGRSRSTFGLSILPETQEEIIDLNNPKQESAFISAFNIAQDSSLNDPLFYHTAVFDKHRDMLAEIKDGFYSSMVYKDSQSRIAVLIQQGAKKPEILLYNLSTKKFEHTNNYVPIINLITCKPSIQNAPIDFETIERSAQLVVKKWRIQQNIIDDTLIICGLYLAPKSKRTFARELLRAFIQVRNKHKGKNRKPKTTKKL